MKLTDFEGMSWADAEIALKDNMILLALSKDEDTRQCALTIKNYGEEAATAILCATLFLKENGVQRTLKRGVSIYKGIISDYKGVISGLEKDIKWLESQIRDIDDWLAWLRPAYSSTADVWPIPFYFKNSDKRAGLANIMLWLGINKLDASKNAEKILEGTIVKFLKEGLERKNEILA